MSAGRGTLGATAKYNDKETYENLSTHQSNEHFKNTQDYYL